jgi:hypothetical protein
VLYDLGVVSTKEPFGRLVSQGMILGEVEYTTAADAEGRQVDEDAPGAVVTRVSQRVTGVACCCRGSSPVCVGGLGLADCQPQLPKDMALIHGLLLYLCCERISHLQPTASPV